MTRGRPCQPRLTRDAIVAEALALAAIQDGPLTLRRLAARMQVTPMAILHHMGSHDALIHAMTDALLAPITADDEGTAPARLANLLLAYATAVRRHPALTLALFAIPGSLPAQAQRLTDTVEALLLASGLPPPEARLRRDILIDWVHGMALSQAAQAQGADDPAPALAVLLAALTPG